MDKPKRKNDEKRKKHHEDARIDFSGCRHGLMIILFWFILFIGTPAFCNIIFFILKMIMMSFTGASFD